MFFIFCKSKEMFFEVVTLSFIKNYVEKNKTNLGF